MRHLHYLELRNFKRFDERIRIELDHPTVLIGSNDCGKTTALQAIGLWSHAVKTWFERKGETPPRERPATALNRTGVSVVPARSMRDYWHDFRVRSGRGYVPLEISLGVLHQDRVTPVAMRFRCQGDELAYCAPDEATLALNETGAIEAAAKLRVDMIHPIAGIEAEEPVIQPGRIEVLIGEGRTSSILRNLCLLLYRDDPVAWKSVAAHMNRFFGVELGTPQETSRGAVDLFYRTPAINKPVEIALAGRGFHQVLLILAYVHRGRHSVLLIDQPDAHLEALRQRQVYALLSDVAGRNGSQAILATHSETVLREALDRNLTILVGGRAENLASKPEILTSLNRFRAEHYVRARQRRHVLYLKDGSTTALLLACANRLEHPAAGALDGGANIHYAGDGRSGPGGRLDLGEDRPETEPTEHFRVLRPLVPELRGLAVLEREGPEAAEDSFENGLTTLWWRRREVQNYVVTPWALRSFVARAHSGLPLFGGFRKESDEVLDSLVREHAFGKDAGGFDAWKRLDRESARDSWDERTSGLPLGDFAEEFFERLAGSLGHPVLLRRPDLHRLVPCLERSDLPNEISEKLDSIQAFCGRRPTPRS